MTRLKPYTSAAGTGKARRTGTVSHSGKTRNQENGISLNPLYTSTMEDIARAVLTGVAIGGFTAAVVEANILAVKTFCISIT